MNNGQEALQNFSDVNLETLLLISLNDGLRNLVRLCLKEAPLLRSRH